ncbi:MAG: ABC transporter ATP-binding protein [Spirochaeta sp. LUC14_002_19_P3]|nr:MAG: ABC transporter ATP-binding protein [Spirochaeta sp. LUC14_002_19_P3]
MNPPLLQLRQLSHRFPNGTLGLDSVSLSIEKGEFIVLAGPNGSGKTILMRHLNGLARPSSGEILLNGLSVLDNLARARRIIGLVFQEADAQIVGQTVSRDAAFGPENLKLPREEISRRVEASLQAAGLSGFENRRPHTLSGGEKRRLAAAGVLAMRPELLVFDEPFTGLDWPGSADLIEVITALHASGTAILLITHDLEKILAHAQRLILMNKGRIHADGPPSDLLEQVEELGIRRPRCPLHEMTWKR